MIEMYTARTAEIDEIDEAIQKHKDVLVGKDKTESQIKAEKREYTQAMNEQLKELTEEREHEIAVISALEDRRRVLNAQQNGQVVPLHIPKPAI